MIKGKESLRSKSLMLFIFEGILNIISFPLKNRYCNRGKNSIYKIADFMENVENMMMITTIL